MSHTGYMVEGTTTPAATVLREAQAAYDAATSVYYQQRGCGGIVVLDPEDEGDAEMIAAGMKVKAATHAGAAVLARWQRAKAELQAAKLLRRRELETRL